MTGACVFCGIVEGRVEASLLYDDQRVVAFMDLNPITPGHLLVIPKAHAACWASSTPRTARRPSAWRSGWRPPYVPRGCGARG